MKREKIEALKRAGNAPGSVDMLNSRRLFDADNGVGIPTIGRESWRPDFLYPYKTRFRTEVSLEEEGLAGAVHFFLDDYRFEAVWNRPEKGLSYVGRAGYALSPDFSVYRDHPLALQLFNVYRSRWCGALWQSRGVRVIPTVSWSDERSYPFCFLGIEAGSVVAVSVVGVDLGQGSTERGLFISGCAQMIERIRPEAVVVYGEADEALEAASGLADCELLRFPSRWRSIKAARKEARDA